MLDHRVRAELQSNDDQKEPLLIDHWPSLRSALQELRVNIQLLYKKNLQMY